MCVKSPDDPAGLSSPVPFSRIRGGGNFVVLVFSAFVATCANSSPCDCHLSAAAVLVGGK